jgi:hypothetical protein
LGFLTILRHLSVEDFQNKNGVRLELLQLFCMKEKLKYPTLKYIFSFVFILNKSTKNFFDQSNGYVKSYFIHDDIHRVMSHYDRPIYERMQKDKSLAKCERDMWNDFTFEEKCKCVLEEAYVIALERKVLPMLFGGSRYTNAQEAFDWSLMRICTNLCSGWFRLFATDYFYRMKEY